MNERQQQARSWRKKAEESRALARRMSDGIAREAFLQTAHGYEDMAQQIENQQIENELIDRPADADGRRVAISAERPFRGRGGGGPRLNHFMRPSDRPRRG